MHITTNTIGINDFEMKVPQLLMGIHERVDTRYVRYAPIDDCL